MREIYSLAYFDEKQASLDIQAVLDQAHPSGSDRALT